MKDNFQNKNTNVSRNPDSLMWTIFFFFFCFFILRTFKKYIVLKFQGWFFKNTCDYLNIFFNFLKCSQLRHFKKFLFYLSSGTFWQILPVLLFILEVVQETTLKEEEEDSGNSKIRLNIYFLLNQFLLPSPLLICQSLGEFEFLLSVF